jgi:hypothetical protein
VLPVYILLLVQVLVQAVQLVSTKIALVKAHASVVLLVTTVVALVCLPTLPVLWDNMLHLLAL